MCTDERMRWFLGSVDVQLAQSQPMTGMPTDVEVPKKVRVVFKTMDSRNGWGNLKRLISARCAVAK